LDLVNSKNQIDMTVLITLTTAGTDTGPFNLFSNLDGYTTAFETGVSKASLIAGYPSSLVPDGTTTIRVMSVNSLCTNYIDIPVSPLSCTCVGYSLKNDSGNTVDFSYTDCAEAYQESSVADGDTVDVCACQGTLLYVPADGLVVTLDVPGCTTTTTTIPV
jgi:hypothetical protein